jgi:hypothetical protein
MGSKALIFHLITTRGTMLFLFPLLLGATVYTQVIESSLFLKLPHPNPPRCFGEGTNFPVSPQSIGGIKGGMGFPHPYNSSN